jgi:hypothetical protein
MLIKYIHPTCADSSISHITNTQSRVRTLTGKEIELDIEADYKVSRIKERVEEKEGIPPVQQRLIYGGKQMYVLFCPTLLPLFFRRLLACLSRRSMLHQNPSSAYSQARLERNEHGT